MDKLLVGIDIEDISRFRKLPYSKNRDFYSKIFTKREIVRCLAAKSPSESFTARFCVKEAVIKACSTIDKLNINEIEVLNNSSVRINSKKMGKYSLKISMSHCKDKAVGIAIGIKDDNKR